MELGSIVLVGFVAVVIMSVLGYVLYGYYCFWRHRKTGREDDAEIAAAIFTFVIFMLSVSYVVGRIVVFAGHALGIIHVAE